MPYKAIIFDRDGTLNATSRTEGGYVQTVDDMKLLPKVKESLERLAEMGVHRYVFTQQRCIGKGLISRCTLDEIHAHLNALLGEKGAIEAYYYCPHLQEANCDCTKPKPGMILQCLADHNLEKKDVLVVGDSMRDWESAKAAGVDYAFVPNDLGKHTDDEYKQTGVPVFVDLQSLVDKYFK